MLRNKWLVISYFLIIFLSIVTFLSNANLNTQVQLFFADSDVSYKLTEAIAKDTNTNTILLTRMFHNKPLAIADTFFVSVYRAMDVVFLFSLSDWSSSPYGGKMNFLPSWELPLFLVAIYYFVRNWEKEKNKYRIFIP